MSERRPRAGSEIPTRPVVPPAPSFLPLRRSSRPVVPPAPSSLVPTHHRIAPSSPLLHPRPSRAAKELQDVKTKEAALRADASAAGGSLSDAMQRLPALMQQKARLEAHTK